MNRTAIHAAVAAALALAALRPMTADAETYVETPDAAAETTELETVQVVGSRRVGRSAMETPVPVDTIPIQQAVEQGAQFDLIQTLQAAAPSYYSTRQSGTDGADLIDSAALRGLGSDQTLVLVNGKRRHSVALVNLFGARNRGSTGTDLSSIPLLAVDRIDILRDGAAAQYGSDAIAGVMNVSLRRDKGCQALLGYGLYTAGDGENRLASAYCGVGFADDGVLAVTGEWMDRRRSDRSEPHDNPRTIGDAAVENRTLWINGETLLGDAAQLYFNAGAQNRDAASSAFARGGIGTEDIPSRNSEAMYPHGFVPVIEGDVADRSATLGLWWDIGEWRADLSTTYGSNRLRYGVSNSLNASIAFQDMIEGGAGISQSSFYAGTLTFRQHTANFDMSRFYDGIAQGMNLAWGAELRRESYGIDAGELASWVDADGVGQWGNAGSQGFPGFQPVDATDVDRDSVALYGDLEFDLSERWMTAVALRWEDYSDFGATLDGKFATAFRMTDEATLRGSLSTGFRAPSLQQAHFSSTFTDYIGGQPLDVVLASNGGQIARAAGIPELTEETSHGGTVGFTWAPRENLSMTLDVYRIDIGDRIVLSGRFGIDDPSIGNILQNLGVGQAQFFVNSVDTRTTGLDLTVSHAADLSFGSLETFFGVGIADTDVVKVHAPAALAGREHVLLDEREKLFIEEGAPSTKAVLGFDLRHGRWNTLLKVHHFGSQTLGTFSGPPVPNQHYSPQTSADLSFTYNLSEQTKLTFGGANILDAHPTRQDPNETDNGHIFDSVQFGLNGASLFARLSHRF